MFYTDEEISVITGFLNGYLVRDHASAKVKIYAQAKTAEKRTESAKQINEVFPSDPTT